MSQPRSLSRCWLPLLAISILLGPARAAAQAPSCAEVAQCRSHLDQGMAFDLERNYELALREFQAAYKQEKDPRLALNIGRTLHKLGRFAEAISWYKRAGQAAPADRALQERLQDFLAQSQQSLPAAASVPKSASVVNKPPLVVQTAPMTANLTATAINHNVIQLDASLLRAASAAEPKPLYKRASLWVPVVGLVVAAGAAGLAASLWGPWQPDGSIPSSTYSAVTVRGAR